MWTFLKSGARLGRLRCSFCGRDAEAVERLVAGAAGYICDSCIEDCVAVLQQHGGFELSGLERRPTH